MEGNFSFKCYDELSDQKFGYWTVLYRVNNSKSNHICYKCRCSCGTERIIKKTHLINNKTQSCGCNGGTLVKGKRFGRLVCESDAYRFGPQKRLWVNVKCDCGTQKSVLLQSLKVGLTISCGCYMREKLKKKVGLLHPRYNPNLTEEDRKYQDDRTYYPGYQSFRRKVLKYDNYTCQCCGTKRRKNMIVHHIKSWNTDKENRINPMNALTLCPLCHNIEYENSFHKLYGNGNNDGEQIEEYINKRRKQLGILIPFKIDEYIKQKETHRLDDWLESINTDPADPDWSESLLFQPKEEING